MLSTGLLFPSLQLLTPSCLLCTHTIPEGLNLRLALAPVLVLGHALLHCKVRGSTARAGDQLVQWVLLLIILLHRAGPIMAWWDRGRHLEEPAGAEERARAFRPRRGGSWAVRTPPVLPGGSRPSGSTHAEEQSPLQLSLVNSPCRARPQPVSSGKGPRQRTNGDGISGKAPWIVLRDCVHSLR